MQCEMCSKEGAHFCGSSKSWGPDESDAGNVPENLPGGYSWLCDECATKIVQEEVTLANDSS